MKKQGILLLLFAAISFMFAVEAYSTEEAGRVLAVKKNVYVIRNDNRGDAAAKMPILMNDAVETDEKSRTKLFFTDDSILSLGEMSRVEVEEYLYNSEENKSKSIYKLMDGYLKVVVGRSDLEIHTPTAVAAARGTKFIVVTGGEGKAAYTDVIVLSGRVDTWSSIKGIGAGMVSVGPGTSNRIQMNEAPQVAKQTQASALMQVSEPVVVAVEPKVEKLNFLTKVAPKIIVTPPPPPPAPPPPPPPPLPTTPVVIDISFD